MLVLEMLKKHFDITSKQLKWVRIYLRETGHRYLALFLDNMGYAYGQLGDTKKALEYYKKAEEMVKRLNSSGLAD